MIDQVVAELKAREIERLDLVIANAGINRSRPKTFMEIDPDDQMELFKINVSTPNNLSPFPTTARTPTRLALEIAQPDPENELEV